MTHFPNQIYTRSPVRSLSFLLSHSHSLSVILLSLFFIFFLFFSIIFSLSVSLYLFGVSVWDSRYWNEVGGSLYTNVIDAMVSKTFLFYILLIIIYEHGFYRFFWFLNYFFISTFISSTNGTLHIYFWDFDIIACFSLLIVNNITSA